MKPLPTSDVDVVAHQLAQAARLGTQIDALTHEPSGVADGYRIQAAGHRVHGDDLVGWKAGCTNEGAQQMLQIDAPVFGRYRRDHVEQSPTHLGLDDFAAAVYIEVEIGLRLTSDIDEIPRDPLDLAASVEAFAAIEVVTGRLAAFPLVGAAQLVADNVASGRMIVGPTLDLDVEGIRGLDRTSVELEIDDAPVASGTGAEVLGHPLLVLRDLAVHAAVTGEPLRADDLVITGTCTGLVAARPAQRHVGRVGNVEAVVVFD